MINKKVCYPENCKDYASKKKFLCATVKSKFHLSQDALRTATALRIETGDFLNELKALRKGYGEKHWVKFRNKEFPQIRGSKARRYMRVARFVDLEEYPALAHIPLVVLSRICKWMKEGNIGKFLFRECGINARVELTSSKSIVSFQKKVKKFSEELPKNWETIDPHEKLVNESFEEKEAKKIKRRNNRLAEKLKKSEAGQEEYGPDPYIEGINNRLRGLHEELNDTITYQGSEIVVAHIDLELVEDLCGLLTGVIFESWGKPLKSNKNG